MDKPIILHVTSDVFFAIMRGEKVREYRPYSRYYASRLEKARDFLAYELSIHPVGYQPPLFIEFLRAYVKRDSYQSFTIHKVKEINLIKMYDAVDYALLRQLYPLHESRDLFYEIILCQ